MGQQQITECTPKAVDRLDANLMTLDLHVPHQPRHDAIQVQTRAGAGGDNVACDGGCVHHLDDREPTNPCVQVAVADLCFGVPAEVVTDAAACRD